MEPMISKTEVMTMLGISASTLDRLVQAGQIPSYKIRGRYRFFASEIAAYVNAHRVVPKPAAATPPARGRRRNQKATIEYIPGMRVV